MKKLALILFMLPFMFVNAQSDSTTYSIKEIKKDTSLTWYYTYPKGPRVDTTMKPYVDMFLADCKKARLSTKKFYKLESITYSVLPGAISGVCIPRQKKVYIDAMTAANYPNGLKLLIYHELGHCAAGLAHIPNESGLAIMNPYLDFQDLDKYYDNWETLVIMLFSDMHPKLRGTANDCCPDMITDPCTHSGHKH